MDKVHDKLLVWGTEVDNRTREQASRAARLPFVAGHVALMPDAHVGIGATVGSVIPTEGAIVPSFAGVDLGCGMIATETVYTADDLPDNLDPLLSLVSQRVPAGVGKGRDLGYRDGYRDVFGVVGEPPSKLSAKQQATAIAQFGTLGAGNHFLEVSLDERGKVWTVLHSGSRGIGNQLATFHIGKAKGLMREHLSTLGDPNLAYFTEGTSEFAAYIQDMLWAQRYAYESRARMNSELLKSLAQAISPKRPAKEKAITVQMVNCHHNYTERENHLGRDLWITRKGAIKAGPGELGVIPGSMGTDTYIVRGKGNPDSYNSSSHGAGRRLSRGDAKRQLDKAGLKEQMKGKTWNVDAAGSLIDEDPRAYKDIRQVMADQSDLTEVVHVLSQVLNYKGTG
ncbi:MAG TPA: RtcB family protein [Trebonia sp.]|jgi:tRNA-splicing ligase RtcB|nr:RtcB family protein [Trebonia sp.]